MATGHVNPGYTDTVSRFERARNAVYMGTQRPAAKNLKELQMIRPDPITLEEIRKRAREVWQHKDNVDTSYQDHYRERFSAMDEATPTRPTSPNRRNKPHPPGVFLTTRLHHCPGYHNADTTMGKPHYLVDASVGVDEKELRAQARGKYKATRDPSALNQYKSQFPPEIESLTDPIQRQAARAEYKVAPPREQIQLVRRLRDQHDYEVDKIHDSLEDSERPQTVPALNRYMKWAGADERELVQHLAAKYGDDTIPPVPSFVRKQQELMSMRSAGQLGHRAGQLSHKTRRGDYLLHPQWPPSMRHHRLNGLSSLDVPYIPSLTGR